MDKTIVCNEGFEIPLILKYYYDQKKKKKNMKK